jgi:Trk K+ transport system NAD-binding subunit
MAQIAVPEALVGRALDSLDLGTAGLTLMLVIDRDEHGRTRRQAPEPALVLGPGCELVVVGKPEAIAAFRAGETPQA